MFRRTLLGLFILVAAAIPASAQFNGCVAGFCSSSSQWVFPGATLDLDFANNRYFGVANGINSLTTTRASTGYAEALNGTWVNFGNNIARRTDKGLLVEESRTNSIRNNSMQGAVVGSPGTLPTNWLSSGTSSGLTQTVVGVGIENGVEYIDLRFAGTTSGTITGFNLASFDGNTQVAATTGQSWSQTAFFKLVAGSLTNVSNLVLRIDECNAGGSVLASSTQAFTPNSVLSRSVVTRAFNQATTAFASQSVRFDAANGVAIDFTLRIGWPQLELGAFATSPIRTTNAAATRAADTITLATGSWFNASAGTVFAQFLGPPVNLDRAIWQLSDGSFNNRILLRAVHAGATTNVFGVNGGVSDGILLFVGAPVQNAAYKIAAAYSLNDFAGSKNAATVVTDTTAAVPSMTTLYIGQENSANTSNNYIQRLSYFNSRLSNATLQSITQ